MMKSLAVVLEEPERLTLSSLALDEPTSSDVVVETRWTGVSTGTERLLYTGRMPMFPGMGYPLVPGYETVGEVVSSGPDSGVPVGAHVFVPGAHCFGPVRGLHGGSASRLVVPGARVVRFNADPGENGVLLALAATALHAVNIAERGAGPTLIVGHGALGRLLARISLALGGPAPIVWEKNLTRADGADGYSVVSPDQDDRRNYETIIDVSGDASLLDKLIQRLAPRGKIVLAGFYDTVSFAFAPAFMREASIRIAAQWSKGDLEGVLALVDKGVLSLEGLITHRFAAKAAPEAYSLAFSDPSCVKMVLDWSAIA
jgi:3-hydroxyethyl bacteriochlorophyllide a dehydrogenase